MHADPPAHAPVPVSSPDAPDAVPAGFWIRAAAAILDLLVVTVASVVVTPIAAAAGAISGNATTFALVAWIASTNLGWLLYPAAMESSSVRATLGKHALGMTVAHRHGGPVSFPRALGRAAAKYLNTLSLGFGWLMTAFTPGKRGLHDYVAGTVVVRLPGPQRRRWLAVTAIVSAVSIPAAGVVAAVAVPGLLRARMANNEARAIGALRAIHQAQAAYRSDCGAYAISLSSLSGPPRYLAPELSSADSVSYAGYRIALNSKPGSDVADTPQGCRNTVTDYVAQAAPERPGATGMRSFLIDSEGVVYEGDEANFSTGRRVE